MAIPRPLPSDSRELTILRIAFRLPASTLAAYEAEARASGKELESILSARLIACQNHTSAKPLYITDDQRKELEQAAARNFSSPEALIAAVLDALSIACGDVRVPLSPTLIHRLRTRCFGRPFAEFLAERVVQGLEEFAGMR